MDIENQSSTNTDIKNSTNVTEVGDEISVSFDHVDLTENNPRSEAVEFLIEKRAIEIRNGATYGNPAGVMIDEETPEAMAIAAQAEAIKNLPEIERPSKLMELLRSNLEYAYPDSINKLAMVDMQQAEWVRNKIIKGIGEVKLSEVLSSGFGICRHLSVVYLWLAQKAGLQGILLNSDPMLPIKNIERSDTHVPLFKMTEVGESVPSHAWVELKLSTGEWIPADPSTNLVGDTKEGLGMFKTANYKGVATCGLNADAVPDDYVFACFSPTFYEPGAPNAKSSVSATMRRHIDFTTDERSILPYSGRVDIRIHNWKEYSDSKSSIKKL